MDPSAEGRDEDGGLDEATKTIHALQAELDEVSVLMAGLAGTPFGGDPKRVGIMAGECGHRSCREGSSVRLGSRGRRKQVELKGARTADMPILYWQYTLRVHKQKTT